MGIGGFACARHPSPDGGSMSPADVYVRPSGVAALQDRTIRSSQRFNDLFERITTCWVDGLVRVAAKHAGDARINVVHPLHGKRWRGLRSSDASTSSSRD